MHIRAKNQATNLGFKAEWLDRSLSSWNTWKPICKKGFWLWETRFSGLMKPRLNCLASILSAMSGGSQALLITCPIPSQWWSMVVAASCCVHVFQRQRLEDWSGLRGSWTEQSTEISLRKAWSGVLRTLDWAKEHFPKGQRPQAHSQDNAGVALGQLCECPWVAQPEPLLEPNRTETWNLPVHVWSPSNLTELERREEEQKIPKSRCAKPVASNPRRLKGVSTAKGASTKYWLKSLNTYVNVIFQFFLFL